MNPDNPNLRTADEWSDRYDELRAENQRLRAALEKFVTIAEFAGTFSLGAEYVIDPDPSSAFGKAALEAKQALEWK